MFNIYMYWGLNPLTLFMTYLLILGLIKAKRKDIQGTQKESNYTKVYLWLKKSKIKNKTINKKKIK